MKFEIKFKHTLEQTYTSIVYADNEKEALEKFDDDPFNELVSEDCEDEQGLEIEVLEVITKQ